MIDEINLKYGLTAFGIIVFICANVVIAATGWTDEFDKLYASGVAAKTKIYLLDLLIKFFVDLLKSDVTLMLITELMPLAIAVSTAVVYEGSRRGDSKKFLSLYWWGCQFVAIGAITPYYLGTYLGKKVPLKNYRQVGSLTILANLVGTIGTIIAGIQVYTTGMKSQPDILAMVILLVFPVMLISVVTLFDKSDEEATFITMDKGEVFDSLRMLRETVYWIAILTGIYIRWTNCATVIFSIYSSKEIVNMIVTSGPALFLIFDYLGTMISAIIWLHYNEIVPAPKVTLPRIGLLAIGGPGALLALNFIERDRLLDEAIQKIADEEDE